MVRKEDKEIFFLLIQLGLGLPTHVNQSKEAIAEPLYYCGQVGDQLGIGMVWVLEGRFFDFMVTQQCIQDLAVHPPLVQHPHQFHVVLLKQIVKPFVESRSFHDRRVHWSNDGSGHPF